MNDTIDISKPSSTLKRFLIVLSIALFSTFLPVFFPACVALGSNDPSRASSDGERVTQVFAPIDPGIALRDALTQDTKEVQRPTRYVIYFDTGIGSSVNEPWSNYTHM